MNSRQQAIENLVLDSIVAHQESIIVKLITELESNYIELAKLSSMGEYQSSWTHKQLLDFITYET
jgi:hypothetical protein